MSAEAFFVVILKYFGVLFIRMNNTKLYSYIKGLAAVLNKRAYLKNDVNNNFIPSEPSIGFSDDDPKNIEVMKKHFKDKPDNIVRTYSTAGGLKKEV